VHADGTVHKQAVSIGLRTERAVQITSGLTAAATVVTEGGYGLDDGTRVTVSADKNGESGDKH
jgi:HlyD family secretion protein